MRVHPTEDEDARQALQLQVSLRPPLGILNVLPHLQAIQKKGYLRPGRPRPSPRGTLRASYGGQALASCPRTGRKAPCPAKCRSPAPPPCSHHGLCLACTPAAGKHLLPESLGGNTTLCVHCHSCSSCWAGLSLMVPARYCSHILPNTCSAMSTAYGFSEKLQ